MLHRFLTLTAIAITFLALLSYAEDVAPSLNQYEGKILILRGFYSGSRLHYDGAGNPGAASSGDWTTDGFVYLHEIRVEGQTLKIKASRQVVVREKQGFRFQESNPKKLRKNKKQSIEIEAALGTQGSDQIDLALSRIFLSARDSLADLVPSYWQICVSDGLAGKNEACRFSAELTSVPGVAPLSAKSPVNESSSRAPEAEGEDRAIGELSKIGKGVSPPKALYQMDPEFTESAREARFQGVVTLMLVVDKDGQPKNIHIVSPLGFGLDAQAVRSVKQWRFKPAERDGQPVAVEIGVEIDFHLY